MSRFPHWIIQSHCSNLNELSKRIARETPKSHWLSWGKCMESCCKWMITELKQNSLQLPIDNVGWMINRIATETKIEKLSYNHVKSWDRRAYELLERLNNNPDTCKDSIDGLFNMRAYRETTRIQSKEYKPVISRPSSWYSCYRTIYSRLLRYPKGREGPFITGWTLRLWVIRRNSMKISDEWLSIIRIRTRFLNDKIP